MKKIVLLFLALTISAFGQVDGPIVSPSGGPPPIGYTSLSFYDASSRLEYVCYARSMQPSAAITVTNVVDAADVGTVTATAHGLLVGAQVIISGSATAALNGTFRVLTTADANTFTIATSGLADDTYTDTTITTTAPRSTQAQWVVQRITYNADSLLYSTSWSRGLTSLGSVCSDRATLIYQ
jgi:hypothetical protein